ncbi:hypothetical protein [Bradyrhizobium japonicum]|uniref:hypothetical protein n=1 Tax=Bradyrhizobium japonicum TaxID=375 RepID=UPI00271529C3|nr:hypothetical protein [Bradyrhizobium japonicum]WLB56902.1 hypothetical protein QIH94_13250 [Bradyrhizobium japonicum]WLB61204.1 hypothetical protein QIH96_32555 [Bradyrhizobium japonicum]
MDVFLNWLNGISEKDKVEIFKIVLEKGLLAFLIALAAYLFARRQEKAKAFEVRRLELEKITIPRVYAFMDKTDALWRDGRETQAKLNSALSDQWMPWLNEVISHTSTPVEANSSFTGEEILACPLKNGLTMREHFVVLAPDYEMKKRLRSVTPTGDELFLKSVLTLYEFTEAGEATVLLRQSIQTGFLLDFFKDLTREERNAFSQRTEDFLMEAKNVVPLFKGRVFEGVTTGAAAIKRAIVEFPADAPETDLLLQGHLAIASQLHEAIRP